MRIVYGKSSVGREHRLERPLCERAVADVAPLGRAHATRLPDRVGREVVVVHVAAVTLEREVVDALALLRRAERQQRHDLRLAAGEEARAVGARHDRHLDLDRADLRRSPAVGATLVDRDLLADEALVDRLARLLDVALRERVLDGRLAVDVAGPTGNGSSTLSTMCSKSRLRFADLSSFESCSASVSPAARSRTSRGRPPRRRPSAASRGSAPATCGPAARRRPSPRRRRATRRRLPSRRSPRRSQPPRGGPAAGCAPRSGGRTRPRAARSTAGSSHFVLPGFERSSSCASQSFTISRCAISSASRSLSSCTWFAPASTMVRPSFVPTTIRSRSDFLDLLQRRVDDEVAVDRCPSARRRSGRGTAAATPSAPPRPR